MNLLNIVIRGTQFKVYEFLNGNICISIAHEEILRWKDEKIFMFGIGKIGVWAGTAKTQIHLFFPFLDRL